MRLWRRTNALSERRFGLRLSGERRGGVAPFFFARRRLAALGLADFGGVRKWDGGKEGGRQGRGVGQVKRRPSARPASACLHIVLGGDGF